MTLSRRVTNSQRASSSTSILLTLGIAVKSKRVERLYRREARLADAALDHAPFAIDELQLDQAHQIARVIEPFGGAKGRDFVVLAQDGRQLQLLEMMGEQYFRRRAHAAISLIGPNFWSMVSAR